MPGPLLTCANSSTPKATAKHAQILLPPTIQPRSRKPAFFFGNLGRTASDTPRHPRQAHCCQGTSNWICPHCTYKLNLQTQLVNHPPALQPQAHCTKVRFVRPQEFWQATDIWYTPGIKWSRVLSDLRGGAPAVLCEHHRLKSQAGAPRKTSTATWATSQQAVPLRTRKV